MDCKLYVIPKRDPLELAIDRYLAEDVEEFALHVAIARAIFRDFPELVQAKSFPSHLKAAYEGNPDKLSIPDPFRPEARAKARKEFDRRA